MTPNYSTSPPMIFLSLWRHRYLIWQMTKRDVIGRYRGSVMGLFWSFFNPLLLLAVYTFVFSVVFQARWGVDTGNKMNFAVVLFSGLIVHAFFADCINRAPGLILSNVNYVKKVVFPLEILPWIAMGSALFHAGMSLLVLLGFIAWTNGGFHWTVIFLPVVLSPLLLLTMGASWFLASFGVFVRDVGQAMGLVTMALMFLSPIFYPISSLPEAYRGYLYLNPLTFMIGQTRAVLLMGNLPNWAGLGLYLLISLLVAWLGLFWFQKTRKGFADVL